MESEGKTLERLILEKKARDKGISTAEAIDEIVADGCERMLNDTKIFERLAERDAGLAKQIANHIKKFLKSLYAGITQEHYESETARMYVLSLQEIWDSALENALTSADGTAEPGEKRKSFIDYAEDGRGRYVGDYPKGTPKKAKSADILSYIQNVWSKKPITLQIWQNGEQRTIQAEFDPTYDESQSTHNDATKLMGGNRMGSASEQRVTLDLASDYYKIASEAQYNYSKDETGKDNPAHKGVKTWHYFVNGIYFAEYGSDSFEPYMVTINVKEKDNGTFVYSAEKEKRLAAPGTLHAPVNNTDSGIANSKPYDESITSGEKDVKRFSTKTTMENMQEKYRGKRTLRYSKADAEYCYERGFDWGGLYEIFHRVSCWCCPLQSMDELRKLYRHFPDLWRQLERWDDATWRTFIKGYSARDLAAHFDFEKQWQKAGGNIRSRAFYAAMRGEIQRRRTEVKPCLTSKREMWSKER